jgi:K+-sensing histidine kinase KdpD
MNGKVHVEGSAGDATDAAWDGMCSAAVLAELVTDGVFVVDERLAIVQANTAFLSLFGLEARASFFGRSLCSVADCCHANDAGKCGSGPACQACGWLLAVGSCGEASTREREVRILRKCGDAFDFAVTVGYSRTTAFRVCGLKDLYATKRLSVLERSFFHDVTNLAAGIRGLCEVPEQADDAQGEGVRVLLHDSADKLVEAIERLRTLRVAENGDLRLWLSAVEPQALLQAVAERFREEASARHLMLVLEKFTGLYEVETDRALLAIVLNELARNAIEASVRGDRVTFRWSSERGRVFFTVHNPAVLDAGLQAHVFERSFTTKGSGRGVGAYLAKLIAERYLKGTLDFVSHEHEGTTFRLVIPVQALAETT